MITKGKTYELDNEYLKCTKAGSHLKRTGIAKQICVFQVCDKDGVIKEPVRAKNGFVVDHGTRLVFRRINELIEI